MLIFQMFHTPSFGEEDYDFLQEKPVIGLKPSISQEINISDTGSFSNSFDVGYSPNLHFFRQQQPAFLTTVSHSQYTSSINNTQPGNCRPTQQQTQQQQQQTLQQHIFDLKSPTQHNQRLYPMASQRDSIFESLENITPKFPPQDVDLPDISSANGMETTSAASIMSSGLSAGQMYGQTNMNTSPRTHPDIGMHATSPVSTIGQQSVTTISPASSSVSNVSNVSPPTESSEDSDDSVPLAQVRELFTVKLKKNILSRSYRLSNFSDL